MESSILVFDQRVCLSDKRLRDLLPVGVQASARASQESAGHIGPLAVPRSGAEYLMKVVADEEFGFEV